MRNALDCMKCLPVILASAAHTGFAGLDLECVGTFFKTLLDGVLPLSSLIIFNIQATDTSTNIGITNITSLKTSTVEFQATGTDAITSNLPRGKFLLGRRPQTSRCKGSGIPCQYSPYSYSPCPVGTTFINSVLAIQARTHPRAASTSGLEAVAVKCNAF